MSCDTACVDLYPEVLNLGVYQGGTFYLLMTWTDANNTPVDLSGYSAELRVKDGNTTILDLTSGSEITLGGAAGTITVNVDATATALLAPANCEYVLLLTSGAGVATPLVGGMFTIRQGLSA